MNRNADGQPDPKPPSAASRWGRYLSGYVIAVLFWLLGDWQESYHLKLFGAIVGLGTLMFGTLRAFGKR